MVRSYPYCTPHLLNRSRRRYTKHTMQHDFYPVDILDRNGETVGTKLRKDIDKLRDIFHAIHVLLITPQGEVVMSIIPFREDLPNVYSGKLGTTVATVRRH